MSENNQLNTSLTITYDFPFLPEAASGVLALEFHFSDPADIETKTYQLEISDPKDAEPLFTKSVTINSGSSTVVRTIINTHLLPNGTVTLNASVTNQNNEVVWKDDIKFRIENPGPLAAQVRESMQRHRTPVILDGLCDSSFYDYSDNSIVAWFDRPDALDTIRQRRSQGQISEVEQAALEHFVREGYLIIPERISDELIDQANVEIDEAVAQKWQGYTYGTSQRLEQLHQKNPAIRKIWQHPVIFHYLKLIFGVPARPCQTLVYLFGSQQDEHQDSIHLTPFPAGYMCGIWIPLEDVQPGSGELAIYPGSHRLPRMKMGDMGCPKVKDNDWSTFGNTIVPRWKQMIAEKNMQRIPYLPKAGTVLIWHENLMHAGSPRVDMSKTRRSIVIHSFAEGAVAYYDSTGLPGIVFNRE
jgi:hypothetical protein